MGGIKLHMLIEGTVYDLKGRLNSRFEVPVWNLKRKDKRAQCTINGTLLFVCLYHTNSIGGHYT